MKKEIKKHFVTVRLVPIQCESPNPTPKKREALYVDTYFGEASVLPRCTIVLLCAVGGGTNRYFDTYRNSRAGGPTRQTLCRYIIPPFPRTLL